MVSCPWGVGEELLSKGANVFSPNTCVLTKKSSQALRKNNLFHMNLLEMAGLSVMVLP